MLRALLPTDLRYRVRTLILDTPVVSEAFVALDPMMRDRHRVTRQTRIVIDGFGRSANSYARAAFELANGPERIASHIHSHRAIQLGVKYRLPVIALVRDPRPVIASALQYTPEVAPLHAIRHWIRYYVHVLPLVEDVVIGDFPDVVEDFGAVIGRVNDRFGTSFTRYEKTPAAEATVQEMNDAWTRALVVPERQVHAFARPTPSRRPADEVLAALDARATAELGRATELYERVRSSTRY